MALYERVELNEGELLQFLGVYVLHWRQEFGPPEAGFREANTREIRDAFERLCAAAMRVMSDSRTDAGDLACAIDDMEAVLGRSGI